MPHLGRLLGYGFATWVIALAISFVIYPLKQAGDPLFETVMTLVLATLAVVVTGLHLRGLDGGFVREGVLLGCALLLVNLVLDLPLVLAGPMARPLMSYLEDIGFTYLLYPIVTIGTGMLVAHVRKAAVATSPTETPSEPTVPAAEPVLS